MLTPLTTTLFGDIPYSNTRNNIADKATPLIIKVVTIKDILIININLFF